MGKNNWQDTSDKNKDSDFSQWIGILILMVVFWPVGLFMLLKKMRIFSDPDKIPNNRKKTTTDESAPQNSHSKNDTKAYSTEQSKKKSESANEAAREAENMAREVAAELAQAAREAGNAAKQVFSILRNDKDGERTQSTSGKTGSWESATSQSVSWQSLASTIEHSVTTTITQKKEKNTAPFSSEEAYADSSKKSPDSTIHPSHEAKRAQASPPVHASYQSEPSDGSGSALGKKSGKLISTVLLLISIALFILGANSTIGAAREIWVHGNNRWFDFYTGVFYFIGGFISFISRNTVAKRIARYKRYILLIGDRDMVSISSMSRTLALSARTVKRDIQAMIDAGYLDREAYIDHDTGQLVLTSPQSSVQASDHTSNDKDAFVKPNTASMEAEELSDQQYMSIIQELRELNRTITDTDISGKIDRIEDVTAMIFRIVEDNPEKLPQIRRFLNYYLPTTIKLLKSYSTLEKQGINGENITAAKENISRVLEMLAAGFEQHFDQLFKSDALDIAADITVLENLMQQDGLTESEPILKTMEGV